MCKITNNEAAQENMRKTRILKQIKKVNIKRVGYRVYCYFGVQTELLFRIYVLLMP